MYFIQLEEGEVRELPTSKSVVTLDYFDRKYDGQLTRQQVSRSRYSPFVIY